MEEQRRSGMTPAALDQETALSSGRSLNDFFACPSFPNDSELRLHLTFNRRPEYTPMNRYTLPGGLYAGCIPSTSNSPSAIATTGAPDIPSGIGGPRPHEKLDRLIQLTQLQVAHRQ
jgi:hypothetical protein